METYPRCECWQCLEDLEHVCYHDCGECAGCEQLDDIRADAQFDIDEAQGKNS